MSSAKNAVRVIIGGEEFTVRSELPPEYTREVAAVSRRRAQAGARFAPDGRDRTRPPSSPRSRSPTSCSRPGAATARSPTGSPPWRDEFARLLPPAKRGNRAAAS